MYTDFFPWLLLWELPWFFLAFLYFFDVCNILASLTVPRTTGAQDKCAVPHGGPDMARTRREGRAGGRPGCGQGQRDSFPQGRQSVGREVRGDGQG